MPKQIKYSCENITEDLPFKNKKVRKPKRTIIFTGIDFPVIGTNGEYLGQMKDLIESGDL